MPTDPSINLFTGLNPLGKNTGCIKDKKQQQDILLTEFIATAWNQKLGFLSALSVTYSILVGDHRSYNLTRADDMSDEIDTCNSTHKGVLDLLFLPLVARRLLNWSSRQMCEENNSIPMELAISFARMFAAAISLVRIVVGIALTVALSPLVGLVCLLKPNITQCINAPSNDDESNRSGVLSDLNRL